jgi:DNA repair photolyase
MPERTRRSLPADPPALRWRLIDQEEQPALFDPVVERHQGRGELVGLELLHVRARRLINEVPAASRMPFRFTINAYRGCSHACSYCFARSTHLHLNLGLGEDFERRIVVKVNAVERVRAEVAARSWGGQHIAMGTNTDPYQTCEGRYRLTRGIVQALGEAGNPFSILTKSTLILRDLDVLADAARRTEVATNLSIGTLDREVWRTSEPGTPNPLRRVDAVARLNAAGVRCGVLIAPVLPGISDAPEQLEAVVKACVEAGARSISAIMLHLRPGVREHYMAWLAEVRPDLVDEHLRRYGRSAYASKEDQRALSATVARLVERYGGLAASPAQSRGTMTYRPRAPAPAREPSGSEPEQLRLV